MKKHFWWQKYQQRQQQNVSRRDSYKWGLALFVLLCLAVLVWDVSSADIIGRAPVTASDLTDADSAPVTAAADAAADSVAADPETAAAEVFAAYRLDREQSRAEELSMLQDIINDESSSADAKQQAEQRRLQMANDVQQETESEQLLDAEGFGETVVIKGLDRATVICALELDALTATRIAELVSASCALNFENVVIVNRCSI